VMIFEQLRSDQLSIKSLIRLIHNLDESRAVGEWTWYTQGVPSFRETLAAIKAERGVCA